ncbi:MAG: hypothetical protein EAZ09_18510 [Oscillatoriales cyanobacterium]|nr:MAG: hypothetical protein EAZ18_04275 [Oscillatoriales cyanobacterium]TAH18320.1 MAG: hypothetical protein EAZ09_18510 [Oscillatoriales cyanobacterium]
MQLLKSPDESPVYQGQFGEFTITQSDRTGVIIYRTGLAVAAACFAIGTTLVLQQGDNPTAIQAITPIFAGFWIALGVSLATIHIYMIALHRLLQLFWAIGGAAALFVATQSTEPLALAVYEHPATLWGIGFLFAALNGIYFKEAFCFNRLETKFLTPGVPLLIIGHIWGFFTLENKQLLLASWAVLFIIFAVRKLFQPIPQDIGDKSVFEYIKNQ